MSKLNKKPDQEENIRINLLNATEMEEKLVRLCKLANQLNVELEKANSLISKLASSKH